MSINLLPPKLKKQKGVEKKLRSVLLGLIYLAAMILVLSGVLFSFNIVNKNELDQVIARTEAYKTEAKAYSEIKEKITKTNSKLDKISQIDNNRVLWSVIIAEIEILTPAQVTIRTMDLSHDSKIINTVGKAESRYDVVLFKDKLEASPFFKNVTFSSSSFNPDENNYSFALKFELEKNK
ncbi:MAG: PilN domain-containing protein [Patescibacteria group bacterium]|jgi:Tfp pilus assembly protein PilN